MIGLLSKSPIMPRPRARRYRTRAEPRARFRANPYKTARRPEPGRPRPPARWRVTKAVTRLSLAGYLNRVPSHGAAHALCRGGDHRLDTPAELAVVQPSH